MTATFLIPFGVVPASALSQGDECSQSNQTRKSGKTEFKCVGTLSVKYWIQLPSVIPLQKLAPKIISNWVTTTQGISVVPTIKQYDIDSANSDLAKSNTSADLVAKSLLKSKEVATNFQTIATNISTLAQKYKEAVIEKRKIYDRNLDEYTSTQKKTDAYYSQYQSALSSRSAAISCTVLKDFGFVGSCSNNAFQDALDVQTIRTYNSLKFTSDAAFAEYERAYETWKSTYKLESKELLNAKIASDKADLYVQRSSEWENISKTVSAQQEHIQDFLKVAEFSGAIQVEMSNLVSKTLISIEAVNSANKQNYKSRYQTAVASVQYLKYAAVYFQSKLDGTLAYSPLRITIEEPQVWIPKSYFKSTDYSNLENISGIDFAWSWSPGNTCQYTTACTNILIVTKKDCTRTVVGLDFMTEAKVSEAKTYSREYSLKAGEISLIEAESKFTDTATSAYLRSFKCLAG
jgi:hypothetical protein